MFAIVKYTTLEWKPVEGEAAEDVAPGLTASTQRHFPLFKNYCGHQSTRTYQGLVSIIRKAGCWRLKFVIKTPHIKLNVLHYIYRLASQCNEWTNMWG